MRNLKQKLLVLVAVFIVLLLAVTTAQAQTPTPESNENLTRSIRGAVYKDVNGDGNCINTGVEGEEPVPGIDIAFVSSDRETTVYLYTGDDGTYGLAAAGESNWEVTARPDPEKWVVTSENPLYALISPDNPVQTGINFCISELGVAGTGSTNAVIVLPALLPESGAAAPDNGWQTLVLLTAVVGLGLIAIGTVIELRRRTNQ